MASEKDQNSVRSPLIGKSKTRLEKAVRQCNPITPTQNPISYLAFLSFLQLITSLNLPQLKDTLSLFLSLSLPLPVPLFLSRNLAFHVWLSSTSSFYISADGAIGPVNSILILEQGGWAMGEWPNCTYLN